MKVLFHPKVRANILPGITGAVILLVVGFSGWYLDPFSSRIQSRTGVGRSTPESEYKRRPLWKSP
jgi:hypothetical protein